jgi:hypothetical protein
MAIKKKVFRVRVRLKNRRILVCKEQFKKGGIVFYSIYTKKLIRTYDGRRVIDREAIHMSPETAEAVAGILTAMLEPGTQKEFARMEWGETRGFEYVPSKY